MRYARIQVVHHMRRAYVQMEMVDQCWVWTVDRTKCTTQPIEGLRAEMWDLLVRVVQPRVQHKPSVHHQVRSKIPLEHVQKAETVYPERQPSHHGQAARSADVDAPVPLWWEDFTATCCVVRDWLFLVKAFAAPIGAATCEVQHKVERPTENQVQNHIYRGTEHLSQWQVPDLGIHLVQPSGLRGWNMRLTHCGVVGELVVFAVRKLPGKIRDQQKSMYDKAYAIIQQG